MLHVCRWGKQGDLVVVISFIGRSQNREKESLRCFEFLLPKS